MIDIKEVLHDIKKIVMLTNNYKPATSTKSQSSCAGAVKNFNSLPHAKNPSDKTSSSHSSGQIIKTNPNVPTGSETSTEKLGEQAVDNGEMMFSYPGMAGRQSVGDEGKLLLSKGQRKQVKVV